MSETTKAGLESIIDELHMEAAAAIASAEASRTFYPWRRHDERIYRERAQKALDAIQVLTEGALS